MMMKSSSKTNFEFKIANESNENYNSLNRKQVHSKVRNMSNNLTSMETTTEVFQGARDRFGAELALVICETNFIVEARVKYNGENSGRKPTVDDDYTSYALLKDGLPIFETLSQLKKWYSKRIVTVSFEQLFYANCTAAQQHLLALTTKYPSERTFANRVLYLMTVLGQAHNDRHVETLRVLLTAFRHHGTQTLGLHSASQFVEGIFSLATGTGMWCEKCFSLVDDISESNHGAVCKDATRQNPQNDTSYGVVAEEDGRYLCTICKYHSNGPVSRIDFFENHVRVRHRYLACALAGCLSMAMDTQPKPASFNKEVVNKDFHKLQTQMKQHVLSCQDQEEVFERRTFHQLDYASKLCRNLSIQFSCTTGVDSKIVQACLEMRSRIVQDGIMKGDSAFTYSV